MISTKTPDEDWTHDCDEDWSKQMNFLQNQIQVIDQILEIQVDVIQSGM
jgi:hypothetical protein